jgi:hypothetical protein
VGNRRPCRHRAALRPGSAFPKRGCPERQHGAGLVAAQAPRRATRRWDDLKAAAVLVAVMAAAHLLNRPDFIPPQARNVPLGLTLFYFGSR